MVKKFIVADFPEAQRLQGLKGFENSACLITDPSFLLEYGDGSYFIEEEWYKKACKIFSIEEKSLLYDYFAIIRFKKSSNNDYTLINYTIYNNREQFVDDLMEDKYLCVDLYFKADEKNIIAEMIEREIDKACGDGSK